MGELRDDLRSVAQEVTVAAGSSGSFTTPTFEPPRHAPGPNPVSRAVRWLRAITRSEPQTSTPRTSSPSRPGLDETPLTTMADQEKKSLAILPFRNLSNDPDSSFYEFSLADAVITELARVRSLVVRPSSVIARYRDQQIDPRQVGHELNVSVVLTAGFIHAGDRFRVTTQLLDVRTGEILWSDRIDTSAADIIAVQDTIAQRIVEGLRLELTSAEQVVMNKPSTQSPAAYEEYLRGRDLFARFIFRSVAQEDCDAAIAHFERAMQLDPNFGLAYDGLGACYVNRVFKGFGGSLDYERAEAAFSRALAIDPNIAEARMLMCFVHLWRGNKQKAREEVARLRREMPNEAVVYFVKATLHRLDGEYKRAIRSYDRLVRLDPAVHVVASYNRALIYIYMGRFDEARRELDNAGEPDNPLVRTFRSLIFYYTGQLGAAFNLIQQVIRQHPDMLGARPVLAMFLSAQGQHDAARAELTEAVKRNAEVDPDIAYSVASVYALEGLPDEAFNWLDRAVAVGNHNRPRLEKDPNWDSLREDPRYTSVLEKMRESRAQRPNHSSPR
jgi:eukaryotic-like serine/threonine-protein kinase